MKRRVTIRDRLAEEVDRYLAAIDVFAALGADPHAEARARAARDRAGELKPRRANTSRSRRGLRR